MTSLCKSNTEFPQYVYLVVFKALEKILAVCTEKYNLSVFPGSLWNLFLKNK